MHAFIASLRFPVLVAVTLGAAVAYAETASNGGTNLSAPEPAAPFAFADFSWSPSNAGASEKPLSWGPFVGEPRIDTAYHDDFSNPIDHAIVGSTEAFRSQELSLTQLGLGGDFLFRGAQRRDAAQRQPGSAWKPAYRFGLAQRTGARSDSDREPLHARAPDQDVSAFPRWGSAVSVLGWRGVLPRS